MLPPLLKAPPCATCWPCTSSLGKGHPSKATAPATRAVRRRSVRGGGCMRKGLLAAVRTSTSPIRAAGDRSVARLRLCQHWCKLRPCSQGVARGRSRCSVGVWLVVRPAPLRLAATLHGREWPGGHNLNSWHRPSGVRTPLRDCCCCWGGVFCNREPQRQALGRVWQAARLG